MSLKETLKNMKKDYLDKTAEKNNQMNNWYLRTDELFDTIQNHWLLEYREERLVNLDTAKEGQLGNNLRKFLMIVFLSDCSEISTQINLVSDYDEKTIKIALIRCDGGNTIYDSLTLNDDNFWINGKKEIFNKEIFISVLERVIKEKK